MPVDCFCHACSPHPAQAGVRAADSRAARGSCCSDGRVARRWQVDPDRPDRAAIRAAGELLSRGGVIIYPTETYYGLGVRPELPAAVERVFQIKGRAFSKPIPLIASDLEVVLRIVATWPPMAAKLAKAFWPGPLTFVLVAAPFLLPQLHAHTGKIGIRISSHPVARALAEAGGGLLTATSANESGRPPCRALSEMPEALPARVDVLLDAGTLGTGTGDLPSTIVDLTSAVPRLVRPGCIPWEIVEGVLRGE